MAKQNLCFRSPRYALCTSRGVIYCAVRTKHETPTVAWYFWSWPMQAWEFSTLSSPLQSTIWLSKWYYQKLDVLPDNVPPYIPKEV